MISVNKANEEYVTVVWCMQRCSKQIEMQSE